MLLDEMLSAAIGEQLSPELDVIAVNADPATRGLPDTAVLELATAHDRVVVTDNIHDFAALSAQWSAAGRSHPGLLFVSVKAYPQDRARIGRIVAALRERAAAQRWPRQGQFEFL